MLTIFDMIVKMSFSLMLKYALVIAWMAVIFMFSHQGHEASSGQSMGVVQAIQNTVQLNVPEVVVRKAAHAVVYLVLGALVLNLVKAYEPRWLRAAVWSLVIVCLYAITDEVHQFFIDGRSGQVSDVLLDTAGGFVGIALVLCLKHSTLIFNRK